MKKMLFIYNPHSGKGLIKENLSDILNIFCAHGYHVDVRVTQRQLDAKIYVEKYGFAYDRIVCSGGDGTINEVITGMMELDEKPVLGYIPAGSTNDFSIGMKIPKRMVEAAEIAVKGMPVAVDIGGFNSKKFIYIAAFGMFTDVSYMTPQEMKNVLGHSAYVLEGIKKLTSVKSYHMKISFNGKTIEDDFIYGMVTNAVSVGGFKGITGKSIVLDDGLFEVTLIKTIKNPLELQTVLTNLIGMDIKSDSVISFKTSRMKIESEEKIPWVIDGEYGGSPKNIVIRNYSQAIQIMSGIAKKGPKNLEIFDKK